jgi:putative hydrolase of the HAD superfamily
MSFTVRAVTLDLDDTLWPFAPIGARIEQAIHDWMRVHSPRTAEMFSIPAMRALRERTFADNPQLAHDLSALRWLTLAHALRESGADPSLLEPAFEAFYAARSEVECYPDSLAALQRIAARMPEIHVFRGSKSSGPFTDGRCHAGRRTLE